LSNGDVGGIVFDFDIFDNSKQNGGEKKGESEEEDDGGRGKGQEREGERKGTGGFLSFQRKSSKIKGNKENIKGRRGERGRI
jgi:hypothetical protein